MSALEMLNLGPWGVVFMQLFIVLGTLWAVQFLIPKPKIRKTIVVLGSGGHTSEMFRFLSTVKEDLNSTFRPRYYVIANTDPHSEAKALEFEASVGRTVKDKDFFIVKISRSREVGQSYITSVVTTIVAFFSCFRMVMNIRPDLVLANGPGTCLPVCVSAFFFKTVGYLPHCFISLSESYACVSHLSLTGKLLFPYFVGVFFVQWPALKKKYPKAIYSGRLPLQQDGVLPPRVLAPGRSRSYVFVTVGTTLFDDLIKVVDSKIFCELIKQLGYTGIHIQYGKGRRPNNVLTSDGFEVEIFDFKKSLAQEISNAELVIGHAGVGTIFETLEQSKDLIVVPNTALMNNHQAEICEEMVARKLLLHSTCSTLVNDLQKADFSKLAQFPKEESKAWKSTLYLTLGIDRRSMPLQS